MDLGSRGVLPTKEANVAPLASAPLAPGRGATFGALAAPSAIAFASVLFRMPSLVNAAATNSDAAVCGLQAMHALRGEVSPFLWGSGYQTSVDSLVAALGFGAFGPSPLLLMLSTLFGHIALTMLVFATLRRHLERWTSALLVTPLVFTGGPIHTYVLYPPRQASLTLAFAAVWVVDLAARARPNRRAVLLAGGAAVSGLSIFADPYALLFAPALLLLAFLVAYDEGGSLRNRLRLIGVSCLGFAAGLLPYEVLAHSGGASRGQTSLRLDVLSHNFTLLIDSGLPWLLGTTPYAAEHMSDYAPWHAPLPLRALAIGGAALLVMSFAWSLSVALRGACSRPVARLGLFGAALVPLTIGGFLLSPMVMDHFSSRYLVAFLLGAPLALAPLAERLGMRVGVLLAPFVAAAAVSGWVSYAPFTHGLAVDTSWGEAREERRLSALLHEKGIRYAEADYWASYRLTFLFREDPIIVPTNAAEDRYAPYRKAFVASPRVAYVFDKLRSREAAGSFEGRVRRGETEFDPDAERLETGQFTVLLLKRISR